MYQNRKPLISFTVAGQPQGKGRPKASRVGKGIKMRTPDNTIIYENWIKQCAMPHVIAVHDGELVAAIKAYYQIPKSGSKKLSAERENDIRRPTTKPDIDNVLKAIFDSLNGIVYNDDTQIVTVIATKHYSHTPRVEVTFYEYSYDVEHEDKHYDK